MSNRTKIILIGVLTIILVGLLVHSMMLLKSISPTKPSTKTEIAKAPTSQPSLHPTQPPPVKMEGFTLTLPPRNPFNPLVSEKKETAPTRPTSTQPPKLPAPVISQAPSGQTPSPSTTNLVLMGTVIGPKKVAIIKVGEKSVIAREGEEVDGLRLKKIERGSVIFEGLEGELTLKGDKPQ